MIDLVKDIISKNDIKKLIEWLETYPRLTKGELTEKFEKQWSEYFVIQVRQRIYWHYIV